MSLRTRASGLSHMGERRLVLQQMHTYNYVSCCNRYLLLGKDVKFVQSFPSTVLPFRQAFNMKHQDSSGG